jgi:hypothetical protein
MKDFKLDKAGVYFTKHSNFRIELFPHEKFGEMVIITKGPSFGKELFGKKFINYSKAVIAIDVICADKLISKGAKEAREEMMELGLEVE